MAVFKINAENYANLVKDSFLLFDRDFINNNKIEPDDEILIANIKDISLACYLKDADFTNNAITFDTCQFKKFYVDGCKFNIFRLQNLIIGEHPVLGIANYLFVFENSAVETFWVSDSCFNQGFLIRNQAQIGSLRISDTIIYNNLSFSQSKAGTFEIESSTVEFVNIMDATSLKGEKLPSLEIEKINIFRSEISKGISIYESKFAVLHMHKVRFRRTESLNNYQNAIHVSTSEGVKTLTSVRITESELAAPFILSFDHCTEFVCSATQFDKFRVNFWQVGNFQMADCKFSETAYWGFANRLKMIKTYSLGNCEFAGEYNFSNIVITENCTLYNCLFLKYPSFFSGIKFSQTCTYDFNFSRLANLIFDRIRFERVSFKSFDASNAEFRNCTWEEEKHCFYSRSVIQDEKAISDDISEMIRVKDIYAKLRDNFYANSDFISYGKFLISEQEIKRMIARNAKSKFEYFALSVHKYLSSYGENFTQPLLIMGGLWLVLSFLFLFTGFYSGEQMVKYEFTFNWHNTGETVLSFLQSTVFSLKNLVPFPTSPSFFVYSTKDQGCTQTIELIQKILNLILFASFTTALLKYIKK